MLESKFCFKISGFVPSEVFVYVWYANVTAFVPSDTPAQCNVTLCASTTLQHLIRCPLNIYMTTICGRDIPRKAHNNFAYEQPEKIFMWFMRFLSPFHHITFEKLNDWNRSEQNWRNKSNPTKTAIKRHNLYFDRDSSKGSAPEPGPAGLSH